MDDKLNVNNDNQSHADKEKAEKAEFGDKLFDHTYDGIKELDNSLPPWWMILFYITINFSIFYAVLFFGMGMFSQKDELQAEYAVAEVALKDYQKQQEEEAANSQAVSGETKAFVKIDENNVELDTSKAALADGEKIFVANCVACHRNDGGGGIGPNLTDAYWLHGSEFRDIFKLTKYGVPAKGMISWRTQLNPEQIKNVTSYIYALLKDKNVPDGKAPEGVEAK